MNGRYLASPTSLTSPWLMATLTLLGACSSGDSEPAPGQSPTNVTTTVTTTGAQPDDTPGSAVDSNDDFPDVVDVAATFDASAGTWSFDVTMSSPYDSPERYADGWRVLGPDGTVYGVHTLTHDHAAEQPFTRRQSGIAIPDDVDAITIEGRDRANGFGGDTVTISLQTG